MAIDTADKRASAIGIPTFWIAPIPDGTIDAADRLQGAGLYRGIAAAVGVVWNAVGPPYNIRLFVAANWAVNAFVGEAMIRATAGTARMRIRHGTPPYDEATAATIAGSEVTTTSGTYVRVRTPSVALVDGDEHRLQHGSDAGSAGDAYGGDLIQGA